MKIGALSLRILEASILKKGWKLLGGKGSWSAGFSLDLDLTACLFFFKKLSRLVYLYFFLFKFEKLEYRFFSYDADLIGRGKSWDLKFLVSCWVSEASFFISWIFSKFSFSLSYLGKGLGSDGAKSYSWCFILRL